LAEESELVGGISVSVGADDSELEGQLHGIDAQFEAAAKRWTELAQAKVGAVFNATQGAAGRTQRPERAPAAPTVSFGRGALGGASASEYAALERKIAESEGRVAQQTVKTANVTAQQINLTTEKALTDLPPVNLQIDRAAFKAELNAILEDLRAFNEQAQQFTNLPVNATPGAPRGRGRTPRVLPQIPAAPTTNAPTSTTFAAGGQTRTSAEIEDFRREEAARAATAPPITPIPPRVVAGQLQAVRNAGRAERTVRQAIRADQRRDEEVFAQTTVSRADQRERQIEQQIARRRAAITAAGRTSRTEASGLGALFGGTQGALIEANTRLAASDKAVTEAERAAIPFRRRIAEYDLDIAASSGKVAAARIKARDAFINDPKTQQILNAEKKAIEGQVTALQAVQKLQGAPSIARNLLAITAAGAAFGAGLKIIDVGISAATEALGNFIDIQTGFGATSTKVTSELGKQTLAFHGNVDAALAMSDAQANLSTQSSDYIDSQLRLTAQIKAGALAQQQSSELFRAAAGVGNAPSGLFGGFGGIGGTGLFAQQLGGGRGLTETIQQDIGAFRGRGGGQDFLGDVNQGLAYLGNTDVRDFINQQGKQQGNPIATIGEIPGGLGDLLSSLNPLGRNFLAPLSSSAGVPYGQTPAQTGRGALRQAEQQPPLSQTGVAYLKDLQKAGERGARALGDTSIASYRMATSQDEVNRAVSAAAQAGDVYGASLAEQDHIVLQLGNTVADTSAKYKEAIQQIAVGKSITPPEDVGRLALAQERQREIESAASLDAIRAQQAFARPSVISAIGRQQQLQLQTQLPAQAALQNLAAPPTPVGTGIVARNAQEQQRVNAGLKEATSLQNQLNAYYAQGRQVLEDTYKPAIVQNFGQAAGQAFDSALSAVGRVGQQIATIQASISNEQAAYQTAQYNQQLFIARRTLSDIGGLVGKNLGAGESYLGVLERQNLQLSRQGQLLSFELSQRQINFQTALAGFQAPGVTPEERQARIAEAKIEAEFAQKQLDIQKQQFRNQVKIVDISNLRQGTDLVRQIALLVQGRKLTIDVAVKEQVLQRLLASQQKLVAEVNTYVTAVDTLAQQAASEITQLEAAAGHALERGAKQGIAALYGFYAALTDAFSTFFQNAPTGTSGGSTRPIPTASGGIFQTQGATQFGNRIVGEAGGETVAILSHPRAMPEPGTSGATVVNVNFFGDINPAREGDLERITAAVTKALGRQASLKGLRGIG